MELSVRALLQRHFERFAARHRLPAFHRAAAHALATCKTAAQGRHLRRCPHGHVEGIWYNSCRHRSCPQCSSLDIERWLNGRLRWLLPCPHHHLVFTLPSELDELWRLNTKVLTELLFHSAQWALNCLLEDPRRLGARPGVLAVLHTWGRTLSLHPHLHCLVTAGGADPQGQWRAVRGGALVPCRPLGLLFRGRFLRQLQRLIQRGKITLPPDYRNVEADWLLRRCAKRKWTPFISARYSQGRGVLLYLAHYIRGGPFRNASLTAIDDQHVTFRYGNWRERQPNGKPRPQTLTLSVDAFLSRLLLHVPKPHTRVVRGWGIYAHTQRPLAERCREQIVLTADDPPHNPQPAQPPPIPRHSLLCPVCGSRLQVQFLGLDSRPPPPLEARS